MSFAPRVQEVKWFLLIISVGGLAVLRINPSGVRHCLRVGNADHLVPECWTGYNADAGCGPQILLADLWGAVLGRTWRYLRPISIRRHQMETFYPRYWPFVRGIHRWPVNSLHKGQRRGALMFSFTGINVWANNGEVGDLRRYRAHYDVLGMGKSYTGESPSSYRGLMQDCRNSSALAMELLQSSAKPSIFKRPRYLLLRYKPMGSFWMNSTVSLTRFDMNTVHRDSDYKDNTEYTYVFADRTGHMSIHPLSSGDPSPVQLRTIFDSEEA